jgi:protein-disulfide isomerase
MKRNCALAFSVLLALAVIGGEIAYAASPARSAHRGAPTQNVAAAVPSSLNEPFIGNPRAPLMLYYWHDFQCPDCDRFDTQTLPAIVSEYVKTGKLRIVFKDFVIFGADSETAAEVSRAVWAVAPSRFYDWQHTIYERQGAGHSGWASRANLLAITKSVPGIDVARVSALLDRNAASYRASVDADRAEGQRFGIKGTPGFWIDGQAFSGAQPLSFFQQILNADLSRP